MKQILLLVLSVVLGACSTIEPSPSASTAPTPGTIIFGSGETTLRLNEEVAWSVSLHSPVEGTKVNLVITDAGGSELFGYEQFITYPESTILMNRMPLGRFLPRPGAYVMRYVSIAGEVLAEGEFELVR